MPSIQWSRVIDRNSERLNAEELRPLLRPGEEVWKQRVHALKIKIIVQSERPDELLRAIKNEFFRSFSYDGVQAEDGGLFSTHFQAIVIEQWPLVA
jgi:hypothetical protein